MNNTHAQPFIFLISLIALYLREEDLDYAWNLGMGEFTVWDNGTVEGY